MMKLKASDNITWRVVQNRSLSYKRVNVDWLWKVHEMDSWFRVPELFLWSLASYTLSGLVWSGLVWSGLVYHYISLYGDDEQTLLWWYIGSLLMKIVDLTISIFLADQPTNEPTDSLMKVFRDVFSDLKINLCTQKRIFFCCCPNWSLLLFRMEM